MVPGIRYLENYEKPSCEPSPFQGEPCHQLDSWRLPCYRLCAPFFVLPVIDVMSCMHRLRRLHSIPIREDWWRIFAAQLFYVMQITSLVRCPCKDSPLAFTCARDSCAQMEGKHRRLNSKIFRPLPKKWHCHSVWWSRCDRLEPSYDRGCRGAKGAFRFHPRMSTIWRLAR